MKTKYDQLKELIASLKKEEKRVFKLKNSAKKETNFMVLYECLANKPTFSKKDIQQLYKQKGSIKNFNNTVNTLTNKILDSLIEYQRSKHTKLLVQFQKIELLKQRHLFNTSLSILESIEEKNIENDSLKIYYLRLERDLLWKLINNNPHLFFKRIEENITKIKHLNDCIYKEEELRTNYFHGLKSHNLLGISKREKTKLLKQTFIFIESVELNDETINIVKQGMLFNIALILEDDYNIIKRGEFLWNNIINLSLIDINKDSANSLYFYLAHLKNTEDFLHKSSLLDEKIAGSPISKKHNWTFQKEVRILLFCLHNQINLSNFFNEDEIQNKIQKLYSEINIVKIDYYFINFLMLCIIENRNDTGINAILFLEPKLLTKNIQYTIKIYLILFHINLNNHRVVLSFIDRLAQNLKRNDLYDNSLKMLLSTLKKLNKSIQTKGAKLKNKEIQSLRHIVASEDFEMNKINFEIRIVENWLKYSNAFNID